MGLTSHRHSQYLVGIFGFLVLKLLSELWDRPDHVFLPKGDVDLVGCKGTSGPACREGVSEDKQR